MNIATLGCLNLSVPQKCEAILVPISNVVVLEPWVFNGLEEVDCL